MNNHPVVLDVDGEVLVVGDRVRSRRGEGVVSALIPPSPPIVRITRGEGHPVSWMASVDVNDPPNTYRCPDLQKIKREGDALDG